MGEIDKNSDRDNSIGRSIENGNRTGGRGRDGGGSNAAERPPHARAKQKLCLHGFSNRYLSRHTQERERVKERQKEGVKERWWWRG